MDANDGFDGKPTNLNCFYMHTIFEQKYIPQTGYCVQAGSIPKKKIKANIPATFDGACFHGQKHCI